MRDVEVAVKCGVSCVLGEAQVASEGFLLLDIFMSASPDICKWAGNIWREAGGLWCAPHDFLHASCLRKDKSRGLLPNLR